MRVIPLICVGDPPDVIAKRFPGTPQEVALKVSEVLAEEPYCDYADLILMICKTAPQGGYSEEDVKFASEIIGAVSYCAISTPRSPLMVTEEAYRWLCLRLSAFRWRIAHRRIVDFIHAIKNATSTDLQSAN